MSSKKTFGANPMHPLKIKSRDLNFAEIDGQTQKLISIQDRRRNYAKLRQHGMIANGSTWDRIARRIAALFY